MDPVRGFNMVRDLAFALSVAILSGCNPSAPPPADPYDLVTVAGAVAGSHGYLLSTR